MALAQKQQQEQEISEPENWLLRWQVSVSLKASFRSFEKTIQMH